MSKPANAIPCDHEGCDWWAAPTMTEERCAKLLENHRRIAHGPRLSSTLRIAPGEKPALRETFYGDTRADLIRQVRDWLAENDPTPWPGSGGAA